MIEVQLEIDWREPPLSGEAKLKEAMKHHAGRWARIKKDVKSPTSRVAWRKAGFEAESFPAESDPKLFDIYARWPGDATTADTTGDAVVTTPPHLPAPTTASKTKPVTTKDGVRPTAKTPAPEGDTDLQIPTSGDVTGGYLASRASRAVPAGGETEVRLVGHNPSPVRP